MVDIDELLQLGPPRRHFYNDFLALTAEVDDAVGVVRVNHRFWGARAKHKDDGDAEQEILPSHSPVFNLSSYELVQVYPNIVRGKTIVRPMVTDYVSVHNAASCSSCMRKGKKVIQKVFYSSKIILNHFKGTLEQ